MACPGMQIPIDEVAVCAPESAVPVTVNEVFPAAVLALAVKVNTEVPEPVIVVGLKPPVTPEGRPETLSVMVSAVPIVCVVVTV